MLTHDFGRRLPFQSSFAFEVVIETCVAASGTLIASSSYSTWSFYLMHQMFNRTLFSYILTKHGSCRTTTNYWNNLRLYYNFLHYYHYVVFQYQLRSNSGFPPTLPSRHIIPLAGFHQRTKRSPYFSSFLAFCVLLSITYQLILRALYTSARLPRFDLLRYSQSSMAPCFHCQQCFTNDAQACPISSCFVGTSVQDQAAWVHHLYYRVAFG